MKREKTKCVKGDNAFGVCTVNSIGSSARKDWLVCPYRVIDSEIVNSSCVTIFDSKPAAPPIPISILNQDKGIEDLEKSLEMHGVAFVFFQDKLGGEISISGTASSPEIAFDVSIVEISRTEGGAGKVTRFGFIEIQTMDFHGSYKAAVKNLSDAHRLHKKEFPSALRNNQAWASERMEGPNIANVFKRTFYQTLLKFELSREGAAAGTILALPEAVWESWQPFLGRPTIEKVSNSEFRIVGSDAQSYHGTNAWIFVFDLDAHAGESISPVRIKSRIRVSATDLVQHAFVAVPNTMLRVATTNDLLLRRIRDRIRKAVPTVVVE
ncbi:MAG TPA: hypothetical protein VKT99_17485 [Xanthobacteraceae bacterium]|nr:hypothetical protein [Xanthobacteraceae bacterium]